MLRYKASAGGCCPGLILAALLWTAVPELLCLNARAQNLASNPGFENGNTAGWFPFGSPALSVQTTQVHSGTYAGVVRNRNATWNGIAQSMQGVLQPGVPYNISVFARMASGADQTMQLTMKQTDSNGDSYSAIASGSASSSGWLLLSGQFTLDVSGTLTALTLYVEVPSSATADFLVDDLSVESDVVPPDTGAEGMVSINWNDVHQKIEGFGASSAWRSTWTPAVADMFFSTNSGIGLSLLRTRIAPGGTTVESSIMQMAVDRGARIWSAPWSPQTSFKTANQAGVISVNGGGFNGAPANYQAYANQLAGYVADMNASYGVQLYALSIQNEPDYNTTNYESCVWTAQQLHDFVPYLSAALAASNVASTKIILPESDVWSGDTALYATALNDPVVASLLSIIANHNYVGDNNLGDQNPPAAIAHGQKSLWETEVSTFDSFDPGITNAIYWAKRIHSFLTIPEVNAWHYWWLSASGTDNSGLASNSDVLAKRGYVLGQYSRFVRPNFVRIGVVTNSGPALVTGFKEPLSGKLALVAVNPASVTVTQTFRLTNVSGVTNLAPWLTTSSASLASQPAVAVTSNSFIYELPAMSVSTFTGQASVRAPGLALRSVSGQLEATFSGETGANYNLLSSSDLSHWQTLLVTNPPALPITIVLPGPPQAQGFYRLELTSP